MTPNSVNLTKDNKAHAFIIFDLTDCVNFYVNSNDASYIQPGCTCSDEVHCSSGMPRYRPAIARVHI
jgi:hypothetical protein